METIITQITENAKTVLDRELNRIENDKLFRECPIQEGVHDILKINILNKTVRYALNDFDWDSFNHTFQLPELEKVTTEEFTLLAEQIAKNIESYFFEKKESLLFRYKFKVVFIFRSFKKVFVFEDFDKKSALKKSVDNYIQQVFIDKTQKIKNDREVIILCEHLLDFSLMQLSEKEVINFIDEAFKFFKEERNKKFEKEFIRSILYRLLYWKENEFFPIYYTVNKDFMSFGMTPKPEFAMQVPKSAPKLDPKKIRPEDAGKVELFVRQALWRIQKREPYGRGKADLELAVSDFGSEEAKMYMKEGSGVLPKNLIYFKDNDLGAKANDVFGTISLSIKTETADTYHKALDFIINLLNNGFPKSYEIKFSSKAEKIFLPIKGLAKSQTHRFFAQTLSYPALYDKLQDYANVAMVEFEWYEDVEAGEKSCMPGSYAVFGLGLTDEKYFPLVQKYLNLVDDEHQLVHFDFLEAFAEKWGITEKTIPILIKGAFSGQFQKPMKNVVNQLNEQNKMLLTDAINQHKDTYDRNILNYLLLGDKRKR